MARFVLKGECGVDAETREHGTRVYTDGVHRVCADALLLARFSQPAPRDKAADLCAGRGTTIRAPSPTCAAPRAGFCAWAGGCVSACARSASRT